MATSTVPAAIDALVSILGAAAGLSGVQVIDGPPTVDMADDDYLYVGWQPDADDASAEFTQDFAHIGARQRDEHFDVLCYLDTWTGDRDVAARRTRAFVLLAAVEDELRATAADPDAPNLGGAVLWAHLTQGQLRQRHTRDGIQVGLPFRISCRSRI